MNITLPSHLAYLRASTLAGWSALTFDEWAEQATARGITGLITKLDSIDEELLHAAERRGLAVFGSYACYSDHLGAVIPEPPRPVGRDGQTLGPTEWYHGVTPGDPVYDDALVANLERKLQTARVDIVFLDFLRWPGHWETESRDGGSPRPSSFDAATLERFARRLGVRSITPDLIEARSAEWDDFRVVTIREIAARLADVAHRCGVDVGAFLVPLPHDERRRQYGQDAQVLAELVDVFAVMSYQHIAGIDVAGTLALTDEVMSSTGKPTIAMLQTTADPQFSGEWDWGPPIDPLVLRDRATDLEHARTRDRLSAICCFPAEAPLPDFQNFSITERVSP